MYLGLGTNLGDKEQNLHLAIKYIEERIGNIISLSAFYTTAPWGFDSDNSFLNAAICVETAFLPFELLDVTKSIESFLGRKRKSMQGVYADRLIDIDLLLYEDFVISTKELTLPHPLMEQRLFVMEPLAEIAPGLLHPVLRESMLDLYKKLALYRKTNSYK